MTVANNWHLRSIRNKKFELAGIAEDEDSFENDIGRRGFEGMPGAAMSGEGVFSKQGADHLPCPEPGQLI